MTLPNLLAYTLLTLSILTMSLVVACNIADIRRLADRVERLEKEVSR